MSATCLTQPTTPMPRPVIVDDRPATPIATAAPVTPAASRVHALRFVQHPAYGRKAAPAARAWQLDARRPLRARPA